MPRTQKAPLAAIRHSSGSAPDFRQLADFLPQALLVLTAEDHVSYANAAAETLLGISATLMQDKPISQFLVLDAEWQHLLAQVLAQQRVTGRNLPLALPRGGHELPRVTLHVTAMADRKSRIMLLDIQDASARLVHQEQSMQSAAVMAHILAHEVRNPLSGIRGAAQLLKADVPPESAPLLELITNEVDRIGGLLNEVEYFSETRELVREAVNIHEVLRHVKGVAAQGFAAGIAFRESYDPSLPAVFGNRERLVQAVLNLVKNAAEALRDAGTTNPEIHIKTLYRGGFKRVPPQGGVPLALPICVMVCDNGSGIPESIRHQIFDPFVTLGKTGGKGLGLPVVAKIIADHGGVLALEHAEAGNTVFAMQLPASSATTTKGAAS